MSEEKKPAAPVRIQNKIFGFPPEIIDGIADVVEGGGRADAVRSYMTRAYKGPLKIPDRKTIATYVAWIRKNNLANGGRISKIKEGIKRTTDELMRMQTKLDIAGSDPTNLKFLMQKIVSSMLIRMDLNSELQALTLDPRVEANIIKQAGVVLEYIIEMQKLGSTLSSYETLAVLTCQKYMTEMISVIRRAAEDTYGTTKTKEFLSRVEKGHKAIDFTKLRNEATEEVIIIEKEGAGGTKEIRVIAP